MIKLPKEEMECFEEEYHEHLGTRTSKVYYPQQFETCWICSCGKYNDKQDNCIRCGLEKHEQIKLLTPENVHNVYVRALERKQKENAEKEARRRVANKRIGILAIVSICVVFFSILFVKVLYPEVIKKL